MIGASGPEPRPRPWGRGAALHLLLLPAAAGVLLALAWSRQELAAHRYLELGLVRTSAARLAEGTIAGLGLGLLFGAVLLLSVAAGRRMLLAPTDRAGLVELRACWAGLRARPGLAASAFGLGLAALATLTVQYGRLPRKLVLTVVLATLLWVGLRALAESVRGRERPSSNRLWTDPALLYPSLMTVLFLILVQLRGRIYGRLGFDSDRGDRIVLAGAALTLLWTALRSSRPPAAGRRWARTALAVIEAAVLVAPLLLAARIWLAPAMVARQPWNVVVIGVDTLRFDVLQARADRNRTPFLQRWAQQAWLFRRAVSQASWTMPAFASILTGKYPHQHGANELSGRLPDSALTLAELLREAGYRTGAAVSHYYVDHRHGFAQGFDAFDDALVVGPHEILGAGVSDRALEFMATNAGTPFFLFLHYFDPHFAYLDHPETAWADWYRGWLRDQMSISTLRMKRHLMGPNELRYIADAYAEEVLYTDRQIERVIEGLRRLGLERKTLVVVVADHGEELGEDNWIGHSLTMKETVIHVPLLIYLPGRPSRSIAVEEVVETRRIFPTVLDGLGIEGPVDWPAPSLLSLMRPERSRASSQPVPAFSMVWLPTTNLEYGHRARMAAVRLGAWKLLRNFEEGRSLLYDLDRDPAERNDLSAVEPIRFAQLSRLLEAWIQRMLRSAGPSTARPLTDEEQARLRSLGYL